MEVSERLSLALLVLCTVHTVQSIAMNNQEAFLQVHAFPVSQSVSLVKTNCAAASYDFLCWRAKTKRDEFDGELSRKKVNESGKFERASKVVFLFFYKYVSREIQVILFQ